MRHHTIYRPAFPLPISSSDIEMNHLIHLVENINTLRLLQNVDIDIR